jgi:hypothetical protein
VGGEVDCVRGIFILNEIWAQGKNIYFDRHFAWLKYFSYRLVPVLAPNFKQHILSLAEVIKVCYSLAELYVKCVYLNLFGWRGRDIYETFQRGVQAIKVWEPLIYSVE